MPPFAHSDLEQFVGEGFVVLRSAFPRDVAAACRDVVWGEVLRWEGCTTWDQPMVHLRRNLTGPPFDAVMTARLRAALDQLMGDGRAVIHDAFGWWPLLLPGFPGPGGWHVDGTHTHRLCSPEQGLTTLFLFSDIGTEDGGTPVVRRSHHDVARLLAAAEPDGLAADVLGARLPAVEPARVSHIVGDAGDVALMHPFLVHGFGPNRGERIRFACNPTYSLREPMQLTRPDGSHSPVEEAIRIALGLT